MTRLLGLGKNAVLGHLRGINRKHRLRSKHFDTVELPDHLTLEVLDADAMASLDHYPCLDHVLLVSPKLRDLILEHDPSVETHAVQTGDMTVFLVMPVSDSDVMYEADGRAHYSTNGYQVRSAEGLRVSEEPDRLFCNVRNTGLLAFSDTFAAAAERAGVRWSPVEEITAFAPMREHPYAIVGTSNAAAFVDTLHATSDWPSAPAVDHPLGQAACDDDVSDPNGSWASLIGDVDDIQDCARARFCSGMPLPALTGELDRDFAKSKLKKRWQRRWQPTSRKRPVCWS